MSNRNMSRLYQAGGGGNTATPDGLDLFGVKHRRQQENMRLQNDLQQKLIDAEAAHEEALQKLKHEHTNDEVTHKQASEYMSKNNMMDTPENRKAANDALFQQQLDNARQQSSNQNTSLVNAGNALDPNQNPNIVEANKRAAVLDTMHLDPNKMNTVVPLGSTGQAVNAPGVPMDVLKGGTTRQTPIMYGGFRDPKTGQVIDQKMGERNEMLPGSISRALPPVSQNELPPTAPDTSMMNSTMPNGNPSLTAGTFMNDEAERNPSPTPANQQPAGGIGSALTPQWPPRSGLIPGGYDVLGGLGKNYMQQMGNELAPFLKMLMGAGFTPQQQNTATPQY